MNSGKGSPKFGPYSFSRMETVDCPLKFKLQYVERKEESGNTRFGTNIGSHMHEIADIEMHDRMFNSSSTPVRDICDSYIKDNPSAEEFRYELYKMSELFRSRFHSDWNNYTGHEIPMAVDLDGKVVDWDSKDVWFRGKADYTEFNEKTGVIRVVDYKTYPRIHSDEEIEDISRGVGCQLAGYLALGMFHNEEAEYGIYEVYYFRFGTSRKRSALLSRADVLDWWDFNKRKMLAIENLQSFEPIPSQRNCQYCGFVDSCEVSSSASIKSRREAKDAANDLIVLNEKRARLISALGSYVEGADTIRLDNGDQIGHVKSERVSVDTSLFFDLCKDVGLDPMLYAGVTHTNFKKALKDCDDDKKEKLAECLIKEVTTKKKLY